MIEVTPEIIGPGIEEEYADAMQRIRAIEPILVRFPPTNDSPEGRLSYQIKWLRQEIESRRLPIPLDPKYRSTLSYLVGSGEVDYLPGIQPLIGELNRILEGIGMVKARHYPVVLAQIDELLALTGNPTNLNAIEQRFLRDLRLIRMGLAEKTLTLPVKKDGYPGWIKSMVLTELRKIPGFIQARLNLSSILFDAWRPGPCQKPPMAAPNPGMTWAGEVAS